MTKLELKELEDQRDAFACFALMGLLAWKDAPDYEERARFAYKQADAMIKVKNEKA